MRDLEAGALELRSRPHEVTGELVAAGLRDRLELVTSSKQQIHEVPQYRLAGWRRQVRDGFAMQREAPKARCWTEQGAMLNKSTRGSWPRHAVVK